MDSERGQAHPLVIARLSTDAISHSALLCGPPGRRIECSVCNREFKTQEAMVHAQLFTRRFPADGCLAL